MSNHSDWMTVGVALNIPLPLVLHNPPSDILKRRRTFNVNSTVLRCSGGYPCS